MNEYTTFCAGPSKKFHAITLNKREKVRESLESVRFILLGLARPRRNLNTEYPTTKDDQCHSRNNLNRIIRVEISIRDIMAQNSL